MDRGCAQLKVPAFFRCEGHREHLFPTTPTFVSDVFPLNQGLGAADLPVFLLLGRGPFLRLWYCDVCCPSGPLPTEGVDVQLAWQGAGGSRAVQGSCLTLPLLLMAAQREQEKLLVFVVCCLCCLCALAVRGTGCSSSCGMAACDPLAGRRRREEKVVASWDGGHCHGTQQSPLSWQVWLCLLEKNLNINQSAYLLLKIVSMAGNLVGLDHREREGTR